MLLDLVGQAAHRRVAESGGLAAKSRDLATHGAGAIAETVGHVGERRGDGLAHTVGNLRRAGAGAAADPLQASLELPHAPLDVAEVGGDGARISRSTKHL